MNMITSEKVSKTNEEHVWNLHKKKLLRRPEIKEIIVNQTWHFILIENVENLVSEKQNYTRFGKNHLFKLSC